MPNDRSIPDAAVWAVCNAGWRSRGETEDCCNRCPGAVFQGRFREPCYRQAHATITTVQRALAGCETKGGDHQ